eukprot:g45848.t1
MLDLLPWHLTTQVIFPCLSSKDANSVACCSKAYAKAVDSHWFYRLPDFIQHEPARPELSLDLIRNIFRIVQNLHDLNSVRHVVQRLDSCWRSGKGFEDYYDDQSTVLFEGEKMQGLARIKQVAERVRDFAFLANTIDWQWLPGPMMMVCVSGDVTEPGNHEPLTLKYTSTLVLAPRKAPSSKSERRKASLPYTLTRHNFRLVYGHMLSCFSRFEAHPTTTVCCSRPESDFGPDQTS